MGVKALGEFKLQNPYRGGGGGVVEQYAAECDIFNFVKMKELNFLKIPKSFLVESKVATPLAIMYIDICNVY